MKTVLIVLGAILIAVLIAGGSFWGGMAYQTRQANQARAAFFNARGLGNEGQLPGRGQFPPGAGGQPGGGFPQVGGQTSDFLGGRGMTGQVKTIDGNVMTVSTAQDVTTVNLSEATQIEKSVRGTTADLQPGTRVVINGQRDKDGSITANRITILNTDPADSASPPPAGTEP